jgi:hypothetical protein
MRSWSHDVNASSGEDDLNRITHHKSGLSASSVKRCLNHPITNGNVIFSLLTKECATRYFSLDTLRAIICEPNSLWRIMTRTASPAVNPSGAEGAAMALSITSTTVSLAVVVRDKATLIL